MPSQLIAAPAIEPITLAQAKLFLRIEQDDEDTAIAALITAARQHVEAATRRALITQDWRLTRDAWPPGGVIHILPAPLQTLIGVEVADAAGTMHALDPQNFVVDSVGSRIAFAPWTPMQPGRAVGGIVIEVRVGEGDTADAVPAPLQQAMLMLIAHWYELRGVVTPAAQEIPQGVAALLAPFRRVSL